MMQVAMDRKRWTTRGLALVCTALGCWACGDPTGTGEEPPGEEPGINDPVEHANGMFVPETCGAQRNSIALVRHVDLPEALTDVWAYYDPDADREYALAGFQASQRTEGGLYVIDVTEPADPTLRATLEEAQAYDVVTWLNYAYTVTGHADEGELGDREYLYINDELPSNLAQNPDITIWEVASGEMIGTFRDTLSTVHNSYELCDRLVVSYYTKGLVLFDISDPTRLRLLDEYDTDPEAQGPGLFLGAWGVYPYTRSGHVLVSDVDKGLYVFRLEG